MYLRNYKVYHLLHDANLGRAASVIGGYFLYDLFKF